MLSKQTTGVKCVALLAAFLIHSPTGRAAPATLNLAAMGWQAQAGSGCVVKSLPLSDGAGRYTYDCDGAGEAFPSIYMPNSGPHDWRGYNQVHLKIRLSSDDPGIQAGGKDVNVCLYDAQTRHESIPGTPTVQQLVAQFKLHTGVWQTVDLSLDTVQCSDVQGLQIYLYEMPYSYRHHFEVELAEARLVGPDTEQISFDAHSFAAGDWSGSSGGPIGSLKTGDGLELHMGGRGGIEDWSLDGRSYGDGRGQISGILLRDAAAGTAPVMAGGKLVGGGDHLTQSSTVDALGLKLDAEYAVEGDRITVKGTVASTRPGDRAITVYVALPVNALGWRWATELTKARQPFQEAQAVPGLEERISGYPVCALTAPNSAGLTLGIRLDQPSAYRFVVNPAQHLVYVAFDIALIDGVRWDNEPMSAARFGAVIYRHDPQWGIRSALERYYQFFPEFFTNRVKQGGGWELNSPGKISETTQQYLAEGCRFYWGAKEETAKWNHEHGILNLVYIEPEFLQFSLGDYQRPTEEMAMKRIQALTQGNDAEWSKFMTLHYTRASSGHYWSPAYSGWDQRQFLTALMNTALVSGMDNADGKLILGIANRAAWIGDSGVGTMIPCNLSPKIPGGKGRFNYEHCMVPDVKAVETASGVAMDGFGLDSFDCAPDDYRRDNFRYASAPLSFDPKTRQPMIPATFSTVQWLKWLAETCRPQGKVIMGNLSGSLTFSAPYLDIFGNESPQAVHPELLRALAYHRPVTYLPYENQPKDNVQYHLLWGIYPGRGIDSSVLRPMVAVLDKLYQAGWEPVTGATVTGAPVRIERFGRGDRCYLSLYNTGASVQKASVKVNWDALAVPGGSALMGFPPEGNLGHERDGFTLTMQPSQTVVVKLTSASNISH